jgi:hypothetical protein
LAGSDQVDLANFSFNSAIAAGATYNSSTGQLVVNNGTSSISLDFAGSYVLANFKFASDGNGGTIVYDPPVAQGANNAAAAGGNASSAAETVKNAFHFNSDFSQTPQARANSEPGWMAHEAAVRAASNNLWTAVHDNSPGHSGIGDAAHSALAGESITLAQWLAHQSASHLV